MQIHGYRGSYISLRMLIIIIKLEGISKQFDMEIYICTRGIRFECLFSTFTMKVVFFTMEVALLRDAILLFIRDKEHTIWA